MSAILRRKRREREAAERELKKLQAAADDAAGAIFSPAVVQKTKVAPKKKDKGLLKKLRKSSDEKGE